jgi:hypothetical protein
VLSTDFRGGFSRSPGKQPRPTRIAVLSKMPTEIHWPAIALRLVLTALAGTALGMDRSRNGHPAGLRTTLLVTLAASIAMIQMNLLIPTIGKPPNSYAVMDLMHLPLGILTGVGFIGRGDCAQGQHGAGRDPSGYAVVCDGGGVVPRWRTADPRVRVNGARLSGADRVALV